MTCREIEGSDRLKNAIRTLYKTVTPERLTVTHGTIGADVNILYLKEDNFLPNLKELKNRNKGFKNY